MRKTYEGTQGKSKQKFEVIGNRELLVEVPLPVEVWEELQAQVEHRQMNPSLTQQEQVA